MRNGSFGGAEVMVLCHICQWVSNTIIKTRTRGLSKIINSAHGITVPAFLTWGHLYTPVSVKLMMRSDQFKKSFTHRNVQLSDDCR